AKKVLVVSCATERQGSAASSAQQSKERSIRRTAKFLKTVTPPGTEERRAENRTKRAGPSVAGNGATSRARQMRRFPADADFVALKVGDIRRLRPLHHLETRMG